MMIDWTAFKKDGKIVEHSTIQRVTFPFLRQELVGVIDSYECGRAWVKLDDGSKHLVDMGDITYVEGNNALVQ